MTNLDCREFDRARGAAPAGEEVNANAYINATVTRNLPNWPGSQNVSLLQTANNLWNSGGITDMADLQGDIC